MDPSGSRRSEEAEQDTRFAEQLRELGVVGATLYGRAGADGAAGGAMVAPLIPMPHRHRRAASVSGSPPAAAASATGLGLPRDSSGGVERRRRGAQPSASPASRSGAEWSAVVDDDAAAARAADDELVLHNRQLVDRVRQLEGALEASAQSRRQDAAKNSSDAQIQAEQCRTLEDSYRHSLSAAEARVRDAEDHIVQRVREATEKHLETTTALERSLEALRREKEIESEKMHVALGKAQAELVISERDRKTALDAAEEARRVMEEAERRWDMERRLLQEDRKDWEEREAQLLAQLKEAQAFGDIIAGAFGTAEVESAALADAASRVLLQVNSSEGADADSVESSPRNSAQESSSVVRGANQKKIDRSSDTNERDDSDMAVALAVAGVATIPDPREVELELLRQKLRAAESTIEAQAKRWARREKTLLDTIARKEIPSFIHFIPRQESEGVKRSAEATQRLVPSSSAATPTEAAAVTTTVETQTLEAAEDQTPSRSQNRSKERNKKSKKVKVRKRVRKKKRRSRREQTDSESSHDETSSSSSSQLPMDLSSSSPTYVSTYSSIAEVRSDEESLSGSQKLNQFDGWVDYSTLERSSRASSMSTRSKRDGPSVSTARGAKSTSTNYSSANPKSSVRRRRKVGKGRKRSSVNNQDSQGSPQLSNGLISRVSQRDSGDFGDSKDTDANDEFDGSHSYLGSPGQTRRLRRIYKNHSPRLHGRKGKIGSSDHKLALSRGSHLSVPSFESLTVEARRSRDNKRVLLRDRRTGSKRGHSEVRNRKALASSRR